MTMERLHELLRPYRTFAVDGPHELRALIASRAEHEHGREPAMSAR